MKTSDSQPHWNTAVVAPNEAAMVSRNPSTAVTGTRIDRNATSRSTIARPTTMSRKSGNASASFSVMSMFAAAAPVTQSCVPVASSRSGRASRRACTSSAVSSESGAPVGMTMTSAASAPSAAPGAATGAA